ncbi:MAG: fmt [Acidimicrobiaceae bacterium]|nr:MAG: fmt [Acidimicrobiaceae bacterium]
MTRSSPGLPRLVYFGTPAMAVPPLEALVAAGFAVSCVVTRIDKRRGRGGELVPSPVKAAALRLGLRVVHSVDEAIVVARSSGAELGVVVAFGQLIKPDALAAPVERALLAGDTLTGVCLMQLDEGLDTGPIHAVVEVPIGADETGASLRSRLVEVGTALLVDQLTVGLAAPVGQVGDATYAGKLAPSDLRLDWLRPAVERHRIVRLGGAWTTLRGKRLKVLEADLVDPAGSGDTLDGDLAGGLRLRVVQPEGRAAMQFAAFSNGARLMPGEPLGRD